MLIKEFSKSNQRIQTKFLFLHSLITFVLNTVALGTETQVIMTAYLDHNDSPEGPLTYQVALQQQKPPIVVFNLVVFPLVCLFVGAGEAWRIWVIWTESVYVIYVVGVFIFSYVAMIAMYIYYSTVGPLLDPFDERAIGTSVKAIKTGLALLAFSLIAGRIMYTRRRISRLMNGTLSRPSKAYTSIMGMLIESYALSAVVDLGLTVSYAVWDYSRPAERVFSGIFGYSDMISNFLILYRVLSQRAWRRQTERELTTLNFWSSQDIGEVIQKSQTHPVSSSVVSLSAHMSEAV
ncbi:hypothetical protein NP233_g3793 [Leucocoprinus birnbaumii]|uniref:Uncharacterized protein n=1 Tax=Leucocoprinus birnbaumii TaxID=56174 RepID=A0AAD5VWD4_9AGAR|nr:hypothetical protein NP233_g3793 [Leucocoprinus birnbaumii]